MAHSDRRLQCLLLTLRGSIMSVPPIYVVSGGMGTSGGQFARTALAQPAGASVLQCFSAQTIVFEIEFERVLTRTQLHRPVKVIGS